jgi:hypothetical protein
VNNTPLRKGVVGPFANGLFPPAKGTALFARIRWCSFFFAGFAVNVAVIGGSPSLLLIENVKPDMVEWDLLKKCVLKGRSFAEMVSHMCFQM